MAGTGLSNLHALSHLILTETVGKLRLEMLWGASGGERGGMRRRRKTFSIPRETLACFLMTHRCQRLLPAGYGCPWNLLPEWGFSELSVDPCASHFSRHLPGNPAQVIIF